MAIDGIDGADRAFLRSVAEISYCNPFSTKRIALEKEALGPAYEGDEGWNVYVGSSGEPRNRSAILAKANLSINKLRQAIIEKRGEPLGEELHELYAAVVLFILYHRNRIALSTLVEKQISAEKANVNANLYAEFEVDCDYFFSAHSEFADAQYRPGHLFALAFQIARAFFNIYQCLIGISTPMQHLRERVWESIFTHDLRRYRRALYDRMGDVPTIITGPSGTGKELVARAIGMARYIPFDSKTKSFREDFALSFYPLNLAASPTTLIESELFGHKRGAFTGAVADRKGWLELCGVLGTVFLDEVAEIEKTVQVKLLRVLENREFQAVGDGAKRRFDGKIISATNRDMEAELRRGTFRYDLYYRLCADQVTTPGLKERIEDAPGELDVLVEFLLRRWCDQDQVKEIASDLSRLIRKNISNDYAWPGNVRELDQCIRSLTIHRSYTPHHELGPIDNSIPPEILEKIRGVELTSEELISWYCRYAYGKLQNFELAGKRLGIDRRTVRARVKL